MIELVFVRILLHLVVTIAFLNLATVGDWRNSAMARVLFMAALYFLGATVRLMFQAAKLDPTLISDYWLTPVLVALAVFSWWATWRANGVRK